jgi:hypothetical protein
MLLVTCNSKQGNLILASRARLMFMLVRAFDQSYGHDLLLIVNQIITGIPFTRIVHQ